MSRTREITEAEAWLIVAEEFAAKKTARFICVTIDNIFGDSERIGAIPAKLRLKMKEFVQSLLGFGNYFAYPYFNEYAMSPEQAEEQHEARLTALTLFAAMAKDGATEVTYASR